jgi:hypothetical protein
LELIYMEIIKKNLLLIIVTIITLFFSLVYTGFVSFQGGFNYKENDTDMGEFGTMLGIIGFFALALIYAHSFLKMILCLNVFWKKFGSLTPSQVEIKKFLGKILVLFVKTHTFLGVVAVVFIFLHCYLTGSYRDNLLLQSVLVLLVVEGISGFIPKFKYFPAELKRKSYLFHQHLTLGAMIVIFTIFGHLILGVND